MSMPPIKTMPTTSHPLKTIVLIGIVAVAIGGGGFLVWFFFFKSEDEKFHGPTWRVNREVLTFRIVERGTLESSVNSDIYCRVKSRTKGGGGSTTIKWVIEDGTEVSAGDKLIELDESPLVEDLIQQNIKVDEAEAKSIKANEDLEIQIIQNEGDIATAETTVKLAELELMTYLGEQIGTVVLKKTPEQVDKYLDKSQLVADLNKLAKARTDGSNSRSLTEGEYITKRDEILGKIQKNKSDLQMIADRADWSKRMAKIGVVSRSQMEADQAKQQASAIDLGKLNGDLSILERFTLKKTVMDLYSKVQEAKREQKRIKTQARSKKAQAEIERKSKLSIYAHEKQRQKEIIDEIAKCKIYSPQSGLVVYYVAQSSRRSIGTQQSIVAQGEPVREGQKLMQIPDLTQMQVTVRVHEAMVSRLYGDTYRATGFSKMLKTANMLSGTGWARLIMPATIDKLRKKMRKWDYKKVRDGQKALVRVEAFPNDVLNAHVKVVANTASQADFLSSDVRVYETKVSIDQPVEDLKPGMSAEVTIFGEQSDGPVLAIPIQSVAGNLSMGAKRKCYVVDKDGTPRVRDIVVGMSTVKMVEVKSGLKEGETIVLNPRPLLPPGSDLKAGLPTNGKKGRSDYSGFGKGKKGGTSGSKFKKSGKYKKK